MSPEVLEDFRIDPARPDPPLLEVLPSHVLGEVRPQIAVVAGPAQAFQVFADLTLEVLADRDDARFVGPLEIEMVELEQPSELLDGLVVVVDAKVDVAIVIAAVAAPRL